MATNEEHEIAERLHCMCIRGGKDGSDFILDTDDGDSLIAVIREAREIAKSALRIRTGHAKIMAVQVKATSFIAKTEWVEEEKEL